ncbi:hypothetical protein T03_13911, partial [Trichinella britovi]
MEHFSLKPLDIRRSLRIFISKMLNFILFQIVDLLILEINCLELASIKVREIKHFRNYTYNDFNYCSFSQIYHILKHQNVRIKLALVTAIVYKAPAQLNGKIIFATAAGAWDNGEQPFTNERGHSFAKAIEHIVGNNADIKFLAYNNVPPGIPNLKTKSNSKGYSMSIILE